MLLRGQSRFGQPLGLRQQILVYRGANSIPMLSQVAHFPDSTKDSEGGTRELRSNFNRKIFTETLTVVCLEHTNVLIAIYGEHMAQVTKVSGVETPLLDGEPPLTNVVHIW